MSQQMGQQPIRETEDDSPQTQWTFSINLTTTSTFNGSSYKVITGAATITLNQAGTSPYTGTIKFNYPVMQGQPGATRGQIDWTTRTFPLQEVSYTNGILKFTVPTAAQHFQDNFNATTGAPITPPPAGPTVPVGYDFQFCGSWDGSSNVITNGCAWVPNGWLIDSTGTTNQGSPPVAGGSCPQPNPSGPEGERGGGGVGEDPPTGTWGSGS